MQTTHNMTSEQHSIEMDKIVDANTKELLQWIETCKDESRKEILISSIRVQLWKVTRDMNTLRDNYLKS